MTNRISQYRDFAGYDYTPDACPACEAARRRLAIAAATLELAEQELEKSEAVCVKAEKRLDEALARERRVERIKVWTQLIAAAGLAVCAATWLTQ